MHYGCNGDRNEKMKINQESRNENFERALHSDSGHIENWTKIFHCPTRSGLRK